MFNLSPGAVSKNANAGQGAGTSQRPSYLDRLINGGEFGERGIRRGVRPRVAGAGRTSRR